jgi:hypothetical protein
MNINDKIKSQKWINLSLNRKWLYHIDATIEIGKFGSDADYLKKTALNGE